MLFAVSSGPIMCTKGLYQPLFVQAAARILPLRWGYNVYTFAEKKRATISTLFEDKVQPVINF